MEIERKFLIKNLPAQLETYPFHLIEQGYLNTDPVVRVRREDDTFYLTYKGKGYLAREEYNLPLNETAYTHLLSKADGKVITKKRYLIPTDNGLTIELDVFLEAFQGLLLAEVEFESLDQAKAYLPPEWFGLEVTEDYHYSNSCLSQHGLS